jgi:hypothetical protein
VEPKSGWDHCVTRSALFVLQLEQALVPDEMRRSLFGGRSVSHSPH